MTQPHSWLARSTTKAQLYGCGPGGADIWLLNQKTYVVSACDLEGVKSKLAEDTPCNSCQNKISMMLAASSLLFSCAGALNTALLLLLLLLLLLQRRPSSPAARPRQTWRDSQTSSR
jgi:hypothetical protein